MAQLRLRQRDAHLLYLGLLHAEAHPGLGMAGPTGERGHAEALAPLRALLDDELDRAVVELEVPDGALPLLGGALAAAINELKQFAMSDGRSMVPGFAGAARRFFPELAEDPGSALDVVGHGVMLRRRLDAAVRADVPGPAPDTAPGAGREPAPGRWSRLWRR
ncbi:MAG: hypothetical protein OXC94_09030 [Chloroflexi bacterium]|nr:hypothetical protein [Chloroflexota bacterium]